MIDMTKKSKSQKSDESVKRIFQAMKDYSKEQLIRIVRYGQMKDITRIKTVLGKPNIADSTALGQARWAKQYLELSAKPTVREKRIIEKQFGVKFTVPTVKSRTIVAKKPTITNILNAKKRKDPKGYYAPFYESKFKIRDRVQDKTRIRNRIIETEKDFKRYNVKPPVSYRVFIKCKRKVVKKSKYTPKKLDVYEWISSPRLAYPDKGSIRRFFGHYSKYYMGNANYDDFDDGIESKLTLTEIYVEWYTT